MRATTFTAQPGPTGRAITANIRSSAEPAGGLSCLAAFVSHEDQPR